MTYSVDFGKKALLIKDKEVLSFAKTAGRFGVCIVTVVRWTKRLEPQKNRCKPGTKLDMAGLKEDMIMYPDAYQYERADRLGVRAMCIWDALKRIGVSYKKNISTPQSGSRRTRVVLPNPGNL